jgi:hypothetical protein
MESHEGKAKEGGGAWTQPMHPLYIPSYQEDFAKDPHIEDPLKDPLKDPLPSSSPPFLPSPPPRPLKSLSRGLRGCNIIVATAYSGGVGKQALCQDKLHSGLSIVDCRLSNLPTSPPYPMGKLGPTRAWDLALALA